MTRSPAHPAPDQPSGPPTATAAPPPAPRTDPSTPSAAAASSGASAPEDPRAEDLHTAIPSEPDTLRALHARLADAASAHEILDVAYTVTATALGTLLLATTPVGLLRVAFLDAESGDIPPRSAESVLDELAAVAGTRILHAPARLDTARRQLDDYLGGRRAHVGLPLDLRHARGFRGEVQALLPSIPYGATRSYTELAVRAGRPRAVRAVGSACATNPLPLIVPCHRVLRSDGSLGGYIGGLAAKRALLDLEGEHA